MIYQSTSLWQCKLQERGKCHTADRTFGLALVCGLVLFCSCAHYRCDPHYMEPSARGEEMLEYYSYPKQTFDVKEEKIAEKRKYIVKKVRFPSTINFFGNEKIRFDYYVQKKQGRFPTVLMLPISGGVDFTVRSFAKCFASNGFNCAVVHNRKVNVKDTQSAEEVENYFRQTVLDNRQVLDYLVQQEKVDKDKLGCLGLSLGGIRTSLIVGVDERVKCSVMGLAGGSIADIAVTSREKPIRDFMVDLVGKGVGLDDVHAELSEKIKTDPLNLAEYIDARNVLMYIAAFDQVVPRKCGDQLWRTIGKPEVVYFFSGHYGAIIYLPYAQQKSLDFFMKKFYMK